MGLVVLTAAPSQNLVALATARTMLYGGDTSHDAELAIWIAQASAALADHLWPLGRQRYQWTTGGNGRHLLLLPRRPVDKDSVSVTLDGEALDEVVVEDASAGILSREAGWPCWPQGFTEPHKSNLVVTFKAGYVLPDQIATWAVNTVKAAGAWARPSTPTLSPLLFECTTGGTTHGTTEPTWPITTGETVTDGTVTWTARDAAELPQIIQTCAWLTMVYLREERSAGLSSWRDGEKSESYSDVGHLLPPEVRRSLTGWVM